MDGFYAAYMTGSAGMSLALFIVDAGRLTGVDAKGLKYDGRFEPGGTGGSFACSITYSLPENTPLITGFQASSAGTYTVKFELPPDFLSGKVVLISTPVGPINARFEKLRDLGRHG